jgi:hypothetical protein
MKIIWEQNALEIFGPKRQKNKTNSENMCHAELQHVYSSADMISVKISRRTKYARHV